MPLSNVRYLSQHYNVLNLIIIRDTYCARLALWYRTNYKLFYIFPVIQRARKKPSRDFLVRGSTLTVNEAVIFAKTLSPPAERGHYVVIFIIRANFRVSEIRTE